MKLTRDRIEKAVAELFVNFAGQRATRLVLVDDTLPHSNLGGLCPKAVVDQLCRSLGVEETKQ